MKIKGFCCEICGYNKNYAALSFHHLNPTTKKITLDLRSCSNHSWKTLLKESQKCQLLCSNCHVEVHHPRFST